MLVPCSVTRDFVPAQNQRPMVPRRCGSSGGETVYFGRIMRGSFSRHLFLSVGVPRGIVGTDMDKSHVRVLLVLPEGELGSSTDSIASASYAMRSGAVELPAKLDEQRPMLQLLNYFSSLYKIITVHTAEPTGM